ncbi:MAG: phosphoadenosine phosphosulfate reductase family protein [Dehalococcoidia bacterium]
MQEAKQEAISILSFGGGVNSVALMILLLQEKQPLDEVVFADTGSEVPETYAYLEIAERYLANRGVPFRTVTRRNRKTLQETCAERRVIPSAVWRWTTRDFKVRPIHSYYRTLGKPINQYLAIAWDEVERMKDSRDDYIVNLFPLVDRRITRAGCVQIIEDAGLPVPEKSGCFFCPFNSLSRWRWLADRHPELYEQAVELEEGSKHFPSQRLTDQVFRARDNVTLRELRTRFEQTGELESGETEVSPCGGECMT